MIPPAQPPKPRTIYWHPERTRLPGHGFFQRFYRRLLRIILSVLVRLTFKTQVSGLENIPTSGPALIVANHLGDADFVLGLAFGPLRVDPLAAIDLLYQYPVVGWLMDAYGVIWLHRGAPDRRALRAAMQSLAMGRMVAIAPEGRESVTGSLEEGANGAAFLALKAGVPLLPVTFTGTENRRVYANLRRFKRTPVTLTVGPCFPLENHGDFRQAVHEGTLAIMRTLARQLPAELRGAYTE